MLAKVSDAVNLSVPRLSTVRHNSAKEEARAILEKVWNVISRDDKPSTRGDIRGESEHIHSGRHEVIHATCLPVQSIT